MDKRFRITTLAATPKPQQIIWLAMHQDYSTDYVAAIRPPAEKQAGELIVKHLLAGNRGHYGPLEHPQITLACGFFPHSLIQQLRTHRVGVSFDCQSFRYTKDSIIEVAEESLEPDWAFYLRPVGNYVDRFGKKYHYSPRLRDSDLKGCLMSAQLYRDKVNDGMAEEQARGMLPFDYRQHFVLSCNVRSLMHLLDLRWKKDAQLEAQWFCELLFEELKQWVPEIAEWYFSNRAKRALLSP